MKKILLILFILILGACSKPVEEPPVKNPDVDVEKPVDFTYQIEQDISFTEGDKMDFTDKIFGNYDSIEFDKPAETVGDHLLKVKLTKDNQTKTIGIPYTITAKLPSADYYLSSLEVEGYQLEPVFTTENDTYTLTLPNTLSTFTINAKPQDSLAQIVSGTGEIVNPGYNFLHKVIVQAENLEMWAYDINVVFSQEPGEPEPSDPTGVETWNGYYINYPNSQPANLRNDYLSIVNKQWKLDSSYVPSGLIDIPTSYTVYGNGSLVPDAYDAYLQMREAASQEGLILNVSNCYRSYARQKELYTYYLTIDSQEVVDTYSARPGHSEHQLGLACDFAADQLNIHSFTGTPEQLWMVDNAHKFGFILRFPQGKESVTGYQYESWHYRYVGSIASEIKESGLTLEEYLGL